MRQKKIFLVNYKFILCVIPSLKVYLVGLALTLKGFIMRFKGSSTI